MATTAADTDKPATLVAAVTRGLVAAPEQPLGTDDSLTSSSSSPIKFKNGLKLESADGKYALGISGRLQSRFTFDSVVGDQDGQLLRTNDSEYAMNRARLTFKGKANEVSYKLQADFSDGVTLKDFFADYRIPDTDTRIRVGHFKRPSSRQHIGSSATLDQVDRSITHKAFKNVRDTGLAIHNGFEKSPTFEWVIGFYSSSDPGTVSSTATQAALLGENVNPAVVGRVGYNHGDIEGYKEVDLKGGPLRYSLGLGSSIEFDGGNDDSAATRSTVDYLAKAYGFSATGALFIGSMQDGQTVSAQTLDAVGAYQQLGYVIGGRVNPAVRYGFVKFNGPEDIDRHEFTAGLGLYQHGHSLKINTDASAFVYEGQQPSDYQLRTQIQLIF